MDVQYYLDLIPTENYQKPRFMAYLEAVLTNVVNLGTLSESMGELFNIDNAVGEQLDILGELVGVKRLLDYAPANGSRLLSDSEYRTIIKLKIARNEWDGQNGSIKKIYDDLFQDEVRVSFKDEQDVSVTYSILGAFTPREAEILDATGVWLIPAGVSKIIAVIGNRVDAVLTVGTSISGIECIDYVQMLGGD